MVAKPDLYGVPVTVTTEQYIPAPKFDKRGLVMVRFPTAATFQLVWATLHFTAAILHFSSGVYHILKLARSHHDATRR